MTSSVNRLSEGLLEKRREGDLVKLSLGENETLYLIQTNNSSNIKLAYIHVDEECGDIKGGCISNKVIDSFSDLVHLTRDDEVFVHKKDIEEIMEKGEGFEENVSSFEEMTGYSLRGVKTELYNFLNNSSGEINDLNELREYTHGTVFNTFKDPSNGEQAYKGVLEKRREGDLVKLSLGENETIYLIQTKNSSDIKLAYIHVDEEYGDIKGGCIPNKVIDSKFKKFLFRIVDFFVGNNTMSDLVHLTRDDEVFVHKKDIEEIMEKGVPFEKNLDNFEENVNLFEEMTGYSLRGFKTELYIVLNSLREIKNLDDLRKRIDRKSFESFEDPVTAIRRVREEI